MSKMKGAGSYPQVSDKQGNTAGVIQGSDKLASRMSCMRCNGQATMQMRADGSSYFKCNICGIEYAKGTRF